MTRVRLPGWAPRLPARWTADVLMWLGYAQRPPTAAIGEHDLQRCRRVRCRRCGRQGAEYCPLARGNDYRVFARCWSCQHIQAL